MVGVPGEVIANDALCNAVLDDIALIQSLGVKVVLVVGAYYQIEELMRLRQRSSVFVDGYRVTDRAAMRASMEAAGQVRIQVEARLSKGPSVAMVRRHEKTSGQMHYASAIKVVGGNFVAAKRRGIVGGVDFQYTGGALAPGNGKGAGSCKRSSQSLCSIGGRLGKHVGAGGSLFLSSWLPPGFCRI